MRILLVDDEAIQRRALRMQLSRLGLPRQIESFSEAHNGKQCLAMARDHEPDVIFLDLRMPVMGGLEAAASLSTFSAAKIVVLTAFDDFEYAQEAVKVGAVDYLLKPASNDDLHRVMLKICDMLETEEKRQRERQSLLAQLEKVRPLIEQEYVNDIIEGNPLSREVHQEKVEILGLSQIPSWCLLIDAEARHVSGETESQALKQQIFECAKQVLQELPFISGRPGQDRLVFFIALPVGEAETYCLKLGETLHSQIAAESGLAVSMGVSRVVTEPDGLQQAFFESRRALEYKYFCGRGSIVHIDDIGVPRDINTGYPLELDRGLAESVRLGDRGRAFELLDEALRFIALEAQADFSQARFKGVSLVVLLCREALESGAPKAEATALSQSQLELILNSNSIGDIAAALNALVLALLKAVQGVRNMRNQQLVIKAVSYIKEHHTQPIALEDLARQVYLSPFYFSHIFKEELGMTFVEYLTKTRVDEAQEKLRTTSLSIGAIAEQVGYNDVNYFSRVFKRVTGHTPTQYRERLFQISN